MLPEIHLALQRLLYDYGGIPATEVDVRFEAPTKEWIDTLTRPTIDLFLHYVRENTELRQTAFSTTKVNGRGVRQLPARRVDLHYLVSAITTDLDDEHRLLWRTLATLMRHAYLPPEALPEELRDLDPPLVAQITQPKDGPSPVEVWTALGAPPRPSLEYVLTAPLDLEVAFEVPLVLTGTTRYRAVSPEVVVDTRRRIGGIVRGPDGAPLEGVTVALAGSTLASVTGPAGEFTLHRVPGGPVVLRVAEPGGRTATARFDVPADRYDVVLE
jgi:hypothetical protein